MFHQSMSQIHRAKGSKAKRTVQVAVLLAAVVWLLYQTKHSYDRKTEVTVTNYNKLRTGDADITFGRKVNAGSQNKNSIDVHRDNSDETTEMKENALDGDAWNREETVEVEKESQESQLDITTNGNVNDAGEVNTEGARESLRLPSQRESDNLDNNEIKNDSDSSFEQNQLTKEGTTENSDEGSTTPNEASFTEGGQIAGRGSENGETGGENSDKVKPITEESNDTSVSDDQSNTFVSEDKGTTHEGETIEAQEDSQSDTENSMDATSAETSSEGGNRNLVIQDSNGYPGSEGEAQADINSESESQATGNNSIEDVTDDKNSEDEKGNLSNSSEENSSSFLSDNNGSPKDEEIQLQTDNSSEDARTDTTSEVEQSNPDVSQEVATVTKENDLNSHQVAEEVQSQENNDQDSIEEKSDDVASTSAQTNEQTDVEVASLEDDASKVQDATIEPEFKDPATSDL